MAGDKYTFHVAVDACVFTIISGELHVLLIQNKFPPFQNKFAMPGGRVTNDEELEAAVNRVLYDETNVKGVYLRKFNAYGAMNRDPRSRVVAIAFLALIDHEKFQLEAKHNSLTCEWAPVSSVKNLSFDHDKILSNAVDELRMLVQTTNIAVNLLPEKFTLTELQKSYESILDKELDKRNFRKRIDALGLVEKAVGTKMEGAHRPAQLYKFKQQKFSFIKDKVHVFV